MRKRRRLLLAAGAVLLMGICVAELVGAVRRSREPVYNGHPIGYWISKPIGYWAWSGPNRNLALLADRFHLPKVDSNAVHYLVKGLRREDSRWKKWYEKICSKLPLSWQPHLPVLSSAEDARMNSAWMLAELGPASDETIQALEDNVLHSEEEVFFQVLLLVGDHTPAAVNALKRIAGSNCHETLRWEAIGKLSDVVQEHPEIINLFVTLTADPKKMVREAAKEEVDLYCLRLAQTAREETYSSKRLKSLQTIKEIGTGSTNIAEVLTWLKYDPDEQVRTAAREILDAMEEIPGPSAK